MPKSSKGVQHAKSMSLPAKSAGPSRGSGGRGVSHAKGVSLPGRKHSFGEANGGHQGNMKARMKSDDMARGKR